MGKKQPTVQEKQLDVDLWIIALVTLGVFMYSAVAGDYGAITCGIICVLFHPISVSFWGIVEIITCFAAIYGMLLVKKRTGNAWGCVFAFCFIWNAI